MRLLLVCKHSCALFRSGAFEAGRRRVNNESFRLRQVNFAFHNQFFFFQRSVSALRLRTTKLSLESSKKARTIFTNLSQPMQVVDFDRVSRSPNRCISLPAGRTTTRIRLQEPTMPANKPSGCAVFFNRFPEHELRIRHVKYTPTGASHEISRASFGHCFAKSLQEMQDARHVSTFR